MTRVTIVRVSPVDPPEIRGNAAARNNRAATTRHVCTGRNVRRPPINPHSANSILPDPSPRPGSSASPATDDSLRSVANSRLRYVDLDTGFSTSRLFNTCVDQVNPATTVSTGRDRRGRRVEGQRQLEWEERTKAERSGGEKKNRDD